MLKAYTNLIIEDKLYSKLEAKDHKITLLEGFLIPTCFSPIWHHILKLFSGCLPLTFHQGESHFCDLISLYLELMMHSTPAPSRSGLLDSQFFQVLMVVVAANHDVTNRITTESPGEGISKWSRWNFHNRYLSMPE